MARTFLAQRTRCCAIARGAALQVVVMCLISACASNGTSRPANGVSGRRSTPELDRAATPVQRPTDDDIALAVRRRLELAGALPVLLIQVRVGDGIVTLLGRVNRGDERLRAAEIAERTRGVRAVVNRLLVEPGRLPRSDLAQEIRESLLRKSEKEFANVTVTADGTHVRLTGSVPRARSKEIAENATWYVAGVTEVDNQIRVRPSFERTEEELTDEITRNLRADAYVGRAPLSVSVEGGHVRLFGAVQSMFEKRRARERALVAGVIDVDDSAVRVLPERALPRSHAPIPTTDRDVTLAVRDAFRADPRVPEESVDFQVAYGVVTLTGSVRTLAQKLAAAEDARSALGTWAVVNKLEVRPEGGATPRSLDQQVIARLRGHPSVNADRIRVTVDDGKVALAGAVASPFERSAAERVAADVPGVTSVENKLQAKANPTAQRTDAQIETDIERELWWDPRVGDVKIEVAVENGVATLRGEVPNGDVYDAVLENAFSASPESVVDRLWLRQPARFLYSK